MKKVLLLVCVLSALFGFSQPSGYTKYYSKDRVTSGIYDSTFHIPYGTTPALRGGWAGPGALFYKTTDSSLYRWSGTNWLKVGGFDNTRCGLLEPGTIVWDSLLSFTISAATELSCCDGTIHTFSLTHLTLAVADVTNGRYDAIVLDESTNTIISLTGTPSSSPQFPQIGVCQILVTYISIPANATVPGDVCKETIYDENTEWAGVATSVTTNFAGTTNPKHFVKTTDAGAVTSSSRLDYTRSSLLDITNYTSLRFFIRLKSAFSSGTRIQLTLRKGTVLSSALVNVSNGVFGFSSTVTGSYQEIIIPLSAFALQTDSIDGIRVQLTGSNSNGFYLDWMEIQCGITQPALNAFPNGFGVVKAQIGSATSTQPNDLLSIVGAGGITVTALGRKRIQILGSGTVSSFSSGDLSPLFTTSVATATSTPALSFSLSNASPFTVLGRATGTGAPSYLSIDTTFISNFYLKTRGVLSLTTTGTSGAATYNSTTGVFNVPQYASTYTASNGLTLATADFKLGGTLTGNTTITGNGKYLTVNGNDAIAALQADNSSTGNAIQATANDGYGLYAFSVTSFGTLSNSIAGIGAGSLSTSSLAHYFRINPSSTNSVDPVLQIDRWTSGTAANGIGLSIDFKVETDDNSVPLTNQIISKLTNADGPSNYISQLIFTGVNASTTKDLATFSSNAGLVLNGSLALPYTAQTGTYAILATDYFIDASSGTWTATLPTAVGITGRIYIIKNSGAGTITIATTSSQTIDGVTTQTLATQYSSYTLISDGANWKIF